MKAEELRQYLWREPFQAFRVRLKDGRTFDIRDPRLHLAGESVFMIGIPAPDEPRFYDRQEWVMMTEIDGIDLLPQATTH